MSDSQAYEPVTVSSDGVTVAKRFEADEFPVPAIAFRIQSRRSETVTVQLVDDVPEDVAVEDLGFHPEYGSEYWTIDNERITFERDIEPDSEYTTVYGIRATGTENVEKFLTEPRIEMVDPSLDDEDELIDEGASTDVVRDVISGESDSVPGLDDDDEEIETLDLADPNDSQSGEGGTATASTADTSTETDDSETTIKADTVTGALVIEIERGNVDDETVDALRNALGVGQGGAGGGSTDARIQHLQNQVSDLAAYTDSLEEFLDENGTGEDLIEGFQERLDTFQSDLDNLQGSQMETESELEDLHEDVQRVDERLDEVQETLDDLESDLPDMTNLEDALDDRVSDVEADLEDEIEAVEADIQDLKDWREQLSSVIGGQ